MTNNSFSPLSDNRKPIIALDCDGVLLDYQTQIYTKTFGKHVTLGSPKAYHVC
jgi:hypothetical protein